MYSVKYQEKSYNTLFENYLRKAAAKRLINGDEEYIQDILHGEGIENIFIMDLAIHSEILTEICNDITIVRDSYDIVKAKCENLNSLLEPFIERGESAHARVKITLKKDPNNPDSEIPIPSGTQITSTKYLEIEFKTISNTIITK